MSHDTSKFFESLKKRWWYDGTLTIEKMKQIVDKTAHEAEIGQGRRIKVNYEKLITIYDFVMSTSLSPTSLNYKREFLEIGGINFDTLFAILGQAYKEDQSLHGELQNLKKQLVQKQSELDYLSVSRLSRKAIELSNRALRLSADIDAFNKKIVTKEVELCAEKSHLQVEAQEFIDSSLKKSREEVLDFKWRYEQAEAHTYAKDAIIADLKRKNKRLKDLLRRHGHGLSGE